MSDYSPHAVTLYAIIGYMVGGVHFETALGALIGSFFFLTLPSSVKGFKGFFLWIVSLGFGYAVGIPIARGENYPNLAMFTALLGGGLGAAVLTSLVKYVDGGPLPDFLERILNAIPWLNRSRGGKDV